jgi:hypothetical protein
MLLTILISASAFAVAPETHSELICRYLNAARQQAVSERGADMEVTIDAKLRKLNRQATLRALRSVSPTGKISYQTLEASGDGMVRREVIGRYLAAESQTSEMNGVAVTPTHYKFRFSRTVETLGRRIQVFQLSPTLSRLGLFKGELWLDSQSGLPVHESGQFVKTPVFVKHIKFVRDYQIQDGIAIPDHITSIVDTRLMGRAELNIRFSNVLFHASHRQREEHCECQ